MLILSRQRSILTLCAIVTLVAGCDSEEKKPYDYGQFPPGTAAFKDNAPANTEVTSSDLPTEFVDWKGNKLDIRKYRGDKNLVMVVVRGIPQYPGGVPCPFCVAQTNSLVNNYQEFKNRRAEVLVVYPGSTKQLQDFIVQSAKQPDSPFPVLLDTDLAVCDRLGIRGDLAKPSTYIIDRDGNIVYAYVGLNMADRPSLKAMIKVLDRLNPIEEAPAPRLVQSTPPRAGWLDRALQQQ